MKIFTLIISKELNAGPKAPRDIIEILKREYKVESNVFCFSETIIEKIRNRIRKTMLYIKKLDDINIVQYPFVESKKTMKKLGKKSILFIHDINSIRYNTEDETDIINYFKYIICHNNRMKDYLVEKGIDKNKIFVLELFDYLVNEKKVEKNNKFDKNNIKIAYAGNLIKEKSPFLYQLDPNKMNYQFDVYGVGIDKDINKKIIYKNSFKPEELPNNITSDIGLVWDGNFDESDENMGFKNYTKYNNPYKLSCYLAAGIPVIVWKKSAISEFVLENNIGYCVSNLYEINDLDFSDYNEKKKNSEKIAKKVKEGYYTKTVIKKIISKNQKEK